MARKLVYSKLGGGWRDPEGFYITTIDNPGWYFKFNLIGTDLEGKDFTSIIIDRSENNWINCMIKDQCFQAAGGTNNLIEMFHILINWSAEDIVTLKNLDILNWLQKWREKNCDGDWEHMFGVSIQTIQIPGWKIKIDLEETELADKNLASNSIQKTKYDWLEYKIARKNYQEFQGTCSPKNLREILEIFITWADANSD